MICAANLRASQFSGLMPNAWLTALHAALYSPLMKKVLAFSYNESNELFTRALLFSLRRVPPPSQQPRRLSNLGQCLKQFINIPHVVINGWRDPDSILAVPGDLDIGRLELRHGCIQILSLRHDNRALGAGRSNQTIAKRRQLLHQTVAHRLRVCIDVLDS